MQKLTAKGGADVGATSAFVLPMVGAMTIITTFISPYGIKFGWKVADRIKSSTPKSQEASSSDGTRDKNEDDLNRNDGDVNL